MSVGYRTHNADFVLIIFPDHVYFYFVDAVDPVMIFHAALLNNE